MEVSHIPVFERILLDLPRMFSVLFSDFALQFVLNSRPRYFRTKQA